MNGSRFLFFVFFSLSLPVLSAAQPFVWQQVKGPYGPRGQVNDFLILDDGSVLAATEGGVRKSRDHGMTWYDTGGSWYRYTFSSLAMISTGRIFAGDKNKGIYCSDNAGRYWHSCGLSNRSVRSVFVDARDHIYAGTVFGVLFRSVDLGKTWENFKDIRPIGDFGAIECIAVNGSGDVFFGTTRGGVFRYLARSGVWKQHRSTELQKIRALVVARDGTLFAAAEGEQSAGIYRSGDSGETWESVGPPGIAFVALRLQVSDELLAVSRNHGLYVSRDHGESWQALGPEGLLLRCAIRLTRSTLLAGSENAGIWRSADAGTSWEQVEATPYLISLLHVDSRGTVFAGWYGKRMYQPTSATFFSEDAGKNWITIGKNALKGVSAIQTNSRHQVFAGDTEGVHRLASDGRSWQQIFAQKQISALAIDPSDRIVAASVDGKIWRTTDSDTSWAEVFAHEMEAAILSLLVTRDGRIFAGVVADGVYRSLDGGESWARAGLADLSIYSLAADAEGSMYAAADIGFGVFRSVDNGETWEDMGLREGWSISLLAHPDGWLLAGTGNGLFFSSGTPFHWQAIEGELQNVPINALALGPDGSIFLAAGRKGIFRGVPTTTFVERQDRSVPVSYALLQNYPNPFNAGTTIRYRLPRPGFVSLKVYDLTGREVAALVHGNAKAGVHEIHWSPGALASGVYLYRISASGFVKEQKLVLLR